MTHATCRLTAKNRDKLRNPTLCNRVWATFTFLRRGKYAEKIIHRVQWRHSTYCHNTAAILWVQNGIMCARELRGEKLCCHLNTLQSVCFRECSYDHWLANKAYLSDITVVNIYDSFTSKMAAKISWHRYESKLRHCHHMYSKWHFKFIF